MPAADDYAWFAQDNELINGFSLSWVRDTTAAEVVSRLGGTAVRHSNWEHIYDDFAAGPGDSPYPLAITQLAGWSMALDAWGQFGIEDAPLLRLSEETTVIYQFLNVELDENYRFLKDGIVHVEFEPSSPRDRSGAHPDELLDAMTSVGFQAGPASSPGDPAEQEDPTETAFALTEYLTGIRLSMTLLKTQSYLLAGVRDR